MSDLLNTLYGEDYVLISASLELTNGQFLQPTGFPDIGHCIYRDKEGRRWCLVESEQSMANRLEAVCMKAPGVWVDELKGLPLIAVYRPNGQLLTTNLCEPHRIASSYILEGKFGNETMKKLIERKIGLENDGNLWPMDRRAQLERLVFALDPGALLHGFQFVQWKFVGLRQTRLLHARLEAELADEPEVYYGMVKWDAIEPEATREERANKGQSIAAKSRIVPKEIVASFEIDLIGLKSLALDDGQKKFLLALAFWKIGAFLSNRNAFDSRSRQTLPSLRLRADCYLRLCCGSVSWKSDSQIGRTTPGELMNALPKEGERPDFQSLVDGILSELDKAGGTSEAAGETEAPEEVDSASSPSEKTTESLYEGPVVRVTYEPKD